VSTAEEGRERERALENHRSVVELAKKKIQAVLVEILFLTKYVNTEL
jgi:hypothetical protein